MKLILSDQRHGQTKTVVLKGWMKGVLSICFLGAPVALGYFGFQFSVLHNGNLISSESTQTWNQQSSNSNSNLEPTVQTQTWSPKFKLKLAIQSSHSNLEPKVQAQT